MAKKTKFAAASDLPVEVPTETRAWAQSHGSYISGRAYVDEADLTANEMETKWGIGRLRLLVGPELREKFDRQRYLFNKAIWHGELEDVKREAMRMIKAWIAADKAAEGSGARKLDPLVWEVPVEAKSTSDAPTGLASYIAAIVPTNDYAHMVISEGRKVTVYTLDEIARLLAAFPDIAKVKEQWPGALVQAASKNITDPLDSIHDMDDSLEGVFMRHDS